MKVKKPLNFTVLSLDMYQYVVYMHVKVEIMYYYSTASAGCGGYCT